MKIVIAILGFIVSLLAGSFVWVIIALLGSFPLGLLLLKIMDSFIRDNASFYSEINHEIRPLYFLLVLTCFFGILLSRLVAVSLKVLAEKKLEQKK
jgi:hypothetical protein